MIEFYEILSDQVQIVALAFMGTVYTLRLLWIFKKFNAGKEITQPAGNSVKGRAYSLMNVAMPWAMESTRNHKIFYIQFIIFHIGVVASITATFIIPYWPELFRTEIVMRVFQICCGTACVAGFLRIIRRFTHPAVKLISTPDDYFAIFLMTIWFGVAFLAIPYTNSFKIDETGLKLLIAYFALTTVFLIYVPFSKISHYLYYPFIRYYLGKTMGHRDVFPRKKGGEIPAGIK